MLHISIFLVLNGELTRAEICLRSELIPLACWVRATYISDQQPDITSEFTNLLNFSPTPTTPTAPIVLHVPVDQLVPSLRDKDCDALDALMHGYKQRTRGCRSLVLQPEDEPPAPYADRLIQERAVAASRCSRPRSFSGVSTKSSLHIPLSPRTETDLKQSRWGMQVCVVLRSSMSGTELAFPQGQVQGEQEVGSETPVHSSNEHINSRVWKERSWMRISSAWGGIGIECREVRRSIRKAWGL